MNKKLEYPMNLLEDLGIDKRLEYVDLQYKDTEEITKEIEYILTKVENKPRYAQAVILRYRDKMILTEIAEQLQITSKERVRQIIHKAIRILRHPYYLKCIKYGFNQVKQEQDAIERQEKLEYQKKRKNGDLALEYLYGNFCRNKIVLTLQREYNIEYIKDLNRFTPEELKALVLKIRGIGIQKYKKFIRDCIEYGLDKKFDC